VDWIAAGFSEEAFWFSTPRQIARHFDAARKRYRREHDMLMSIAYVAAMAPNMKKPTPLADLLFGDGDARRQTPEERLAIVQQWATVKNR
jgi:hypothetical protein